MASGLPDFHRFTLFKGVDPSDDLITIKTDATGNLIVIAKGMYAGDLINLATDADGRLLMIPYDPENIWGESVSVGNAELAARLRSARTYYRRGETHIIDDFRYGLGMWTLSGSGTGNDQALSGEYSLFGGFTVKLTAGEETTGYAQMYGVFPAPKLSKIGLEVTAWCDDNVGMFEFSLNRYSATGFVWAGIQHDFSDGSLNYLTTGSTWTAFGGTHVYPKTLPLLMPYKLIADFEDEEYTLLRIGRGEEDMSDLVPYKLASAIGERLYLLVKIHGKAGVNGVAYVDTVTITQNEPGG